MKLHLRGDYADGVHVKFSVFMNGANCGQLCMRKEEALFFHHRVMMSVYGITEGPLKDQVISSGKWEEDS